MTIVYLTKTGYFSKTTHGRPQPTHELQLAHKPHPSSRPHQTRPQDLFHFQAFLFSFFPFSHLLSLRLFILNINHVLFFYFFFTITYFFLLPFYLFS